MSRPSRAWLVPLFAVGILACRQSSPGPLSCDTPGLLPGCGAACFADADCARGYACGPELTCGAECIVGGTGCTDDQHCTERGFCVDGAPSDAAVPVMHDLADHCPRVVAQLTGIRPTVELLIDRSASMADIDDGNSLSRWQLVRNALVAPTVGIVYALQANVFFGAALFSSYDVCPQITPSFTGSPIKPALNNAALVDYLFAHYVPRGGTPTAASLSATASYLHALPPTGQGPSIIVLATDGLPNACNDAAQGDDTAAVVAAAKTAFGYGIEVYVLGVDPNTTTENLQAVANAGRGVTSGAPFFRGTSPSQLVQAFNDIIVSKRSCTLTLSGQLLQSDAPSGDIELDGQKLGYDDPNGWSLTSPTTVQLAGSACTHYLEKDASLTATFPCGTLIL